MAKYFSILILVIFTRGLIAFTQKCMPDSDTVCDRAVRFMFDKVLWRFTYGAFGVLPCLNAFGYPGICDRENCPSFQISFCPSECKWESNNKGSHSSDHCFFVGNCTVISKDGEISATCNRTTDDTKDVSNCSAEYCNGNGRCVLDSAYNLVCNCSEDYNGDKCNHAVEVNESDTENSTQIAVAVCVSFIAGILLVLAVMYCVRRLRAQGILYFRKEKEPNEAKGEGACSAVSVQSITNKPTKERSDDNSHGEETYVASYPTKKICNNLSGVTQPVCVYNRSEDDKVMSTNNPKSTIFAKPNRVSPGPENIYRGKGERSSNLYETVRDSNISEGTYFSQQDENFQSSKMDKSQDKLKATHSPNNNDDNAGNAGACGTDNANSYFVLEKESAPNIKDNTHTVDLERKESAEQNDVSNNYFDLQKYWKKATQENSANAST